MTVFGLFVMLVFMWEDGGVSNDYLPADDPQTCADMAAAYLAAGPAPYGAVAMAAGCVTVGTTVTDQEPG